MLFAQGSHVALLVCLMTDDDAGDVWSAYRERLDVAALTPLLSRTMDDAEPWVSRACRSLGNGVCWRFLDELCRRGNGLQPPTGFTSLPDDAKAEVLKRITDGADVAKVECTSRQLRSLVADRDHELWKPLCESWNPLYEPLGKLHGYGAVVDAVRSELVSWKEKYAKTRCDSRVLILLMDSFPLEELLKIKGKPMVSPARPSSLSGLEPETVARGRSAECQHHRNATRSNKKKPQAGAGPVRLPRSRYHGNIAAANDLPCS